MGVRSLKLGPHAQLLGVAPVDGLDFGERGVLVVRAGRAHGADDVVAGAQARGADEVGGDEGVVAALHVAVHAQVPEALVGDLQDALDVAEALGAGGGEVDLLHELGLLLARGVELELAGLLAELGDLHGREVLARERGLGGHVVAVVALLAVALALVAAVACVVAAVARARGVGAVLGGVRAAGAARAAGALDALGGALALGRLVGAGARPRVVGRRLGSGSGLPALSGGRNRGVLRGRSRLALMGAARPLGAARRLGRLGGLGAAGAPGLHIRRCRLAGGRVI